MKRIIYHYVENIKNFCYNINMKNKEKIKEIALKIVELEKTQNFKEMERVISTLNLNEMIEIDEYITTKNLLTK